MPRSQNVIAISSFLEQHFRQAGCNVVKVPPLVDTAESRWSEARAQTSSSADGKLHLLFSGSWARERQDLILSGMEILQKRGRPVVLEYLGSTRENLSSYNSSTKRSLLALGDAVKFHGFVPNDEVLRLSASANFAILLRETTRWSNACFPSKTGELQTLGIPMLCNVTSDLSDYLEDGKNALIVPEASAEAFAATVERALALTPADRSRMQDHSQLCAKSKFDYRNYSDFIGTFLRKIAVRAETRNI
jgi:glycosyltransferase involved in cell wall biosynthesis